MKAFIYILIATAVALLAYNIYKLDFENIFSKDGTVALIGVVACLCAILLMTILLVSKKIAEKAKNQSK